MRTIIITTRAIVFIIVYALVLATPFFIATFFQDWLVNNFGLTWWMVPLVIMATTATMGPFLYIYFERKAEDKLLAAEKKYLEILKQASVGLTRVRNINILLRLIVHVITKIVKVSYAGIYLYSEKTNEYILKARRGNNALQANINFDSNLVALSKINIEPIIYKKIKHQISSENNLLTDRLMREMRLIPAYMVIPIRLEDTLMGFIILGEKKSKKGYSTEDINVFQVFASQSALAIENAQFIEEKTNFDSLTCLWNHGYVQDRLASYVSHAKQVHGIFSFALFDIDNFKQFNDTYGHHVGDIVLCSVAKIIKDNVKKEDTVARYGGEEFCVILNALDKGRAFNVAERIRKAIESKILVSEDQDRCLELKITISGGIACFPEDASDKKGIIKLADEMLYEAKRSGKNKICFLN